ncbi:MAG: hypothetical protein KBT20_10715 [Bacteroidales bacterium]|nr:hypothetical protein [Candidatus Liminaster caballi]
MFFTILGGIIGGLIGGFIGAMLDEATLKDEVRTQCPEAFVIEIKKKKKNALKCGIFDEEEDSLGDIEFESEEGVSDDLYEGQRIYLYD